MTITQQFQAVLARNDRTSHRRKSLLRVIADKFDFVYFGTVDQHVDDHHIVRGFSASPTHQDTSYMVGSYDGSNLIMVDRFDVDFSTKLPKKHRWLICEIQLTAHHDIPHFFLVPHHHADLHYNKLFAGMRTLEPLALETSNPEFDSRYTLYGLPSHHTELESLFTASFLQAIAVHLWPAAIEVNGSSLYFYSAEQPLTQQHVEIIIKNSTWFAQMLNGFGVQDEA